MTPVVSRVASATIVTPEELETLLGLEPAEAERVSQLVQITVEAYCYPTVFTDPVPPPVHAVGLALAGRFAGAQLTKAGAITSETLGSYSYRLASPLTLDQVLATLGPGLADTLMPWAPMHWTAYEVDLRGGLAVWPADWWQRDLDNLLAAYDEATLEATTGPPGPQGPPGPEGPPGPASVSLQYQFSASTTEPPTGSQLRLDAEPPLATRMWARTSTVDGADATAVLSLVAAGSRLYLQDLDDSTRFARYKTTGAPVDKTDYFELPLAVIDVGEPLVAQRVALWLLVDVPVAVPA